MGKRGGLYRVSMPIENLFPHLRNAGYEITSPPSVEYNCVAWAAQENDRWWWPDRLGIGYWPENTPREETLEAFAQAFVTLGYEPCDSNELEPGFEKIAIYVSQYGEPTHVAKQLSSSRWTSKLGNWEDIEHSFEGLENSPYGSVAQVLRRRLRSLP